MGSLIIRCFSSLSLFYDAKPLTILKFSSDAILRAAEKC